MTDKKNTDSDAADQNEFDEHFDDTFDDAFDGDELHEEEFASSDDPEEKPSKGNDKPSPVNKKSGSSFPVIIGIAVLGFLGWKLFTTVIPKNLTEKVFHNKSTSANENVPPVAKPAQNNAQQDSKNTNLPSNNLTPLPPAVTPSETSHTPFPELSPDNLSANNVPPPPATQTDTPFNSLAQPAVPSSLASPTPPTSSGEDLTTLNKEADKELQQNIRKEVQSEVTKLNIKLEEQEKLYKQKLESLERSLVLNREQTSRTLQTIQQEIKTLSNAMQQINQRQQNQERNEIRRSTQAPKPSAAPRAQSELPTLTVYAIIPGRAWLRNNSGQTITVSEGDPIAEYGKVLKIDASAGVVITTSGVTLR